MKPRTKYVRDKKTGLMVSESSADVKHALVRGAECGPEAAAWLRDLQAGGKMLTTPTDKSSKKIFADARARGRKALQKAKRMQKANTIRVSQSDLKAVTAALDANTTSTDVKLCWMFSKHADFGGKTALEMLEAGRVEEVLCAAKTFLKHGS